MKLLTVLILSMFSINLFCQDDNQKFSLQGINEVGLEVKLIIDDEFKDIVKIDESIYMQELRYHLNMAGIKNKSISPYKSELPVLTLYVGFRESRGSMDVINELFLTQKLYFPKAKIKLRCETWYGSKNVLGLGDNWNNYYHDIFMQTIIDNLKSFIADYLEVNGK